MRNWFILLLFVAACGCGRSKAVIKSDAEVFVTLGADISTVNHGKWPKRGSEPEETYCIDSPVELKVILPHDRSVKSYSKITFFSQYKAKVGKIEICPLQTKVEYRSAFQRVDEIASDLGLNANSDLRTRISRAMENPAPYDPFNSITMRCDLDDDVRVFVEVKPDVDEALYVVMISFYERQIFELVPEKRAVDEQTLK